VGVKRVCWCCRYPGLCLLACLGGLWCPPTADRGAFRGERGVRREPGALFGDGSGLVCIKVVSPRGFSQEYSRGVLGTLSARTQGQSGVQTPRGAGRQQRIRSPTLGLCLGCIWPGVWPRGVSDTSLLGVGYSLL